MLLLYVLASIVGSVSLWSSPHTTTTRGSSGGSHRYISTTTTPTTTTTTKSTRTTPPTTTTTTTATTTPPTTTTTIFSTISTNVPDKSTIQAVRSAKVVSEDDEDLIDASGDEVTNGVVAVDDNDLVTGSGEESVGIHNKDIGDDEDMTEGSGHTTTAIPALIVTTSQEENLSEPVNVEGDFYLYEEPVFPEHLDPVPSFFSCSKLMIISIFVIILIISYIIVVIIDNIFSHKNQENLSKTENRNVTVKCETEIIVDSS